MIILYGAALSSYTAKVRVALHWRGIPYTEQEPPGGYRSDAWSQRVPMGTIPAIEHNGFFLAESEAIIEYLEEAFTGQPLLTGSAQDRARMRALARLHDLHVEPRVRALFPLIRQSEKRDLLPQLLAALDDRLQRLARAAVCGPYLAGERPSVADCGFAVTLPLARCLLQALGHTLDLPGKLKAWEHTMANDSSVQAALLPWNAATEAWLSNFAQSS